MVKQDYTYALDSESRLINVKDAQKGLTYYCPCCGAIMIPRQGNKRRWHFAHKSNLENCSYETYLHKIAKRKICECFNESSEFKIAYYPKITCKIERCPVGAKSQCTWKALKEHDLKKYYNRCDEEVPIGNYRADLLIRDTHEKWPPILIEIYVTHKSTEKKLNSNYRIIEIKIESEEDIDQIINSSSIKESEKKPYESFDNKNSAKITFYNFREDYKEFPDEKHQQLKFYFWIDRQSGFFHPRGLEDINEHQKCLSETPQNIKESIFRIEAKNPIPHDFAMFKVIESGLKLRYCTMCNFYRFNDYHDKSICILYKTKSTPMSPRLSFALTCPHFKQKDFLHITDIDEECRIYVSDIEM